MTTLDFSRLPFNFDKLSSSFSPRASIMSGQPYSYSTAPPPPPPRQPANQGTSSAFSSSANPDEDWTQISDLAERRRIQNRIAQRNYRKKLKRRLEDLERRAGSSSESPPQVHAEIKPAQRKQPAAMQNHKPAPNVSNSRQKLSPRVMSHNQYTPPLENDDGMFANTFDREGSQTPPIFAYQSYTPEENIYPSFAMQQSYRPMTTSAEAYHDYLVPAPMAIPSMMHFPDNMRRQTSSSNDDAMNPFAMSYAAIAGMDMQGSQSFEDSHPHTPPLSHSYEHSTVCSESSFSNYPSTPHSLPGSPPTLHHR